MLPPTFSQSLTRVFGLCSAASIWHRYVARLVSRPRADCLVAPLRHTAVQVFCWIAQAQLARRQRRFLANLTMLCRDVCSSEFSPHNRDGLWTPLFHTLDNRLQLWAMPMHLSCRQQTLNGWDDQGAFVALPKTLSAPPFVMFRPWRHGGGNRNWPVATDASVVVPFMSFATVYHTTPHCATPTYTVQ